MISQPASFPQIVQQCAHLGVEVRRDLATGNYTLDGWGCVTSLRHWTWGERRRLLETCSSTGAIVRDQFVKFLLELLTDPVPPQELHPVFTFVALSLMGVGESVRDSNLTKSEITICKNFGWTLQQVDEQSAVELDRVLAGLKTTPSQRANLKVEVDSDSTQSGWNKIVVGDD